jgi:hypothetical protein
LLIDVSFPWHKKIRHHIMTSFCQFHKKTLKTHVVTKSLYIET